MRDSFTLQALPVLALAMIGWGLVSARLGRLNISGPIAFVALGVVASVGSRPLVEVDLRTESLKVLTELTLAVVLFGDAATVPLRRLREDAGLPSRLLLVGLPLTIILGTVGAHLLLPGLSWALCAAIGAAVAPTDAALGAPIVEDERVPRRIRRLLNVESGLNDGIATPFVNIFLVAAVVGTSLEVITEARALRELALGAIVGIAIGFLAGRGLRAALARGLASASFVPIATAAVALSAYAEAVALGGNGFVAAFVAGLAYRAGRGHDMPESTLRFTHQGGQVLALTVWFVFGAIIVDIVGDISWREVAFALVALTVVRMVPVRVALLRSGLDRTTVAVVGWFGPRGLASVVFAILAVEALPAGDAHRVLLAISTTVLLSVGLHGISASPLAERYGASHPEGSV